MTPKARLSAIVYVLLGAVFAIVAVWFLLGSISEGMWENSGFLTAAVVTFVLALFSGFFFLRARGVATDARRTTLSDRDADRTNEPAMTTGGLRLQEGALISVPGLWEKRIAAIDLDGHHRARIRLDEGSSSEVIDVAMSGHLREWVDGVTLKPFDVVTIPEIGERLIGAIFLIRPGRYQFRLDMKYTPSVVVDVLTS